MMNDEALNAVKEGNLEKFKALLDQGIKINTKDADGRTLLHHAVNNSQPEIVECLLQNGADVLIGTKEKNTVLHISVSKNEPDMLLAILDNVAREKIQTLLDMKTKDTGTTALHIAAKCYCLKNALVLLEFGANFEITNNAGEKPVDIANNENLRELFKLIDANFLNAKNGDEQLLSDLTKINYISFTSALNCRNNEGRTLTQVLVVNNKIDLAQKLLLMRMNVPTIEREFEKTYGRDRINEIDKLAERVKTYLKYSTECVGKMTMEFIKRRTVTSQMVRTCCQVLERVHDIFLAYRQFSGKMSVTANMEMKIIEEILEVLSFDPDHLRLVVGEKASYYRKLSYEWKENKKSFVLLLSNLISITVINYSRILNTVRLTHAVNDNDTEKAQHLLDNNVFTVQFDTNNRTVLSYAAENGNPSIVRMLLKAGAKVISEQNKIIAGEEDTVSPIYLAANKGHAEVVKLLLENVDANDIAKFIDRQHKVKGTALHIAAEKGHSNIVKILLRYGATYSIVNGENRTPLDVSANEEVSEFFKIVDECFNDAKMAAENIVVKLKLLQTDEFMAVANTRNSEGNKLSIVAAKAGARHVVAYIFKLIQEATQEEQ